MIWFVVVPAIIAAIAYGVVAYFAWVKNEDPEKLLDFETFYQFGNAAGLITGIAIGVSFMMWRTSGKAATGLATGLAAAAGLPGIRGGMSYAEAGKEIYGM